MMGAPPWRPALLAVTLGHGIFLADTVRFLETAAASGLDFRHVNGAAGRYHLPEVMGAGGAVFDYDVDGDLDVLLLQGRSLEQGGTAEGHRLFRNELGRSAGSPRVRFTDVTRRAGFVSGDYAMGVAVGDYDND